MAEKSDKIDNKTMQQWVREARLVSADWREESWRDCEMTDGAQWSDEDTVKAQNAGIDPITINRTFPTINLILGTHLTNKLSIIAKGRTHKDQEISQVMSEGIQYVLDQYNGEFLIARAFMGALVPGVDFLAVLPNADPRYEKIKVAYRNWKEMYWDPYASPWIESSGCRYVFHQPWIDVEDLKAIYPESKKDIEEFYKESVGQVYETGPNTDEADYVEEYLTSGTGMRWADGHRKRVRPVEMWYTQYEEGLFAVFADGRVYEIRPDTSVQEQYEIVKSAQEVVKTIVRKMKVAVFVGDVELDRRDTPFQHDMFPFVPFVGYTDRFNFPYGVPRQIRGQNIEVNKRRSMALALISSRRVTVEEDVVDSQEQLQALHDEANKLDGFMVVKSGGMAGQKIKIEEQTALAQAQISLMSQSENEIQQISGANAESMGYESNAVSGRAIGLRQTQGATITAPLFANLRRSLKCLGTQIVSSIQSLWDREKVLRVTDRLTGAERFVVLNEITRKPDGSVLKVNNVTQGRFDVIISEAPLTDTVREQNLNLILEWVKRVPPETVPHLLSLAFEMSNLPNKDQLLAKLKPMMGLDPNEEDMSPEELKKKAVQALQQQQQAAEASAQFNQQMAQLTMQEKQLQLEKLKAEIQKILSDVAGKPLGDELEHKKLGLQIAKEGHKAKVAMIETETAKMKAKAAENKINLEAIKTGAELAKIARGANEEGARTTGDNAGAGSGPGQ